MHVTVLRDVCLIHDNACAHKRKLDQDFLETETMVWLHNPSYSPDLSPCDFSLFTLLRNNLLATKCSCQCQCEMSTGCVQKVYLSAFRAWILKLETESL